MRWCTRAGRLERCIVAALAEAHKVIKRPNANTDRIALPGTERGHEIVSRRLPKAPIPAGRLAALTDSRLRRPWTPRRP
jgi:hypothetical protein